MDHQIFDVDRFFLGLLLWSFRACGLLLFLLALLVLVLSSPFNVQTISTIVSSPSLVTSVELTVVSPATKHTWTPEPTSFSHLLFCLLIHPGPQLHQFRTPLERETKRASPPVVTLASLSPRLGASLFGVLCQDLGTRFLICLSPPTHMTTTLKQPIAICLSAGTEESTICSTSPVRLPIQLSLPIDSHSLSPKHSVHLSQGVQFRIRVSLPHNSGFQNMLCSVWWSLV